MYISPKIFCCAVMDTFSRKIVGWSIDNAQDSTLVVNALDMAIKNRQQMENAIYNPIEKTAPLRYGEDILFGLLPNVSSVEKFIGGLG